MDPKEKPAKKQPPSRGLGRGLASLIPRAVHAPVNAPSEGPSVTHVEGEEIHYIPLRDILPNQYQPRTQWNEDKLKELSESIKSSGLLQPLLVRKREDQDLSSENPQHFELIAGERRLKALELAGVEKAPVIVRQVDGKTSLEIAIVENIQREELNPIDEAHAFSRLIEEFHYSQEELSQKVGRDRTTVTNSLRLLNLPEEIQKDLAKGMISAGHARALLSLSQDSDRLSLEKLIIRKALSVREAEKMVREARERRVAKRPTPTQVNPHVRFLEEGLMAILGTKVSIKHRGRKGKIEIEYYSLEDLDRLVEIIKKK